MMRTGAKRNLKESAPLGYHRRFQLQVAVLEGATAREEIDNQRVAAQGEEVARKKQQSQITSKRQWSQNGRMASVTRTGREEF